MLENGVTRHTWYSVFRKALARMLLLLLMMVICWTTRELSILALGERQDRQREEWLGLRKEGTALVLNIAGSPNHVVEREEDRDQDGVPDWWSVSIRPSNQRTGVTYETFKDHSGCHVEVELGQGTQGFMKQLHAVDDSSAAYSMQCLVDEKRGGFHNYRYYDYDGDSRIDSVHEEGDSIDRWWIVLEERWTPITAAPRMQASSWVAAEKDKGVIFCFQSGGNAWEEMDSSESRDTNP